MLSFIRSLLDRYKKSQLQISGSVRRANEDEGVDPEEKPPELPDIENLDRAISYNASHVPSFAPQGFPEWSKIDDPSNTEKFAYDVAGAQKMLGLEVDGFCGPNTINAIAQEDRKDLHSIIIGPRAYSIGKVPVVTYLDDSSIAGLPSRRRNQQIKQVVLHYDVTFNVKSTISVLKNRGLSYNFLVDGDEEATIYQTHNPTLDVCFHAGVVNNYSVGICINNPADPKYQDRDAQRRGRRREVKEDVIHGRKESLLSFFDEQIDSTRHLVKTITDVLDIPFKAPSDDEGNIIKRTFENVQDYEGVLGHYHVSATKKDPAPLDWDLLIK